MKTQMEAGGEFGGGGGVPGSRRAAMASKRQRRPAWRPKRGSISRIGGSWLWEQMHLEGGSVVTSQDRGSGAQEGC